MEKKNHNKAVMYALLSTVIMAVVGTLSSIFPLASIIIYAAAIMFFICSFREGFIFTLPFIIAAYVFVAFSTSFSAAIGDILGPALAAAVMGELTRLNRNQGEVLIKGILTAIICNISALICIKLVDKKSLLSGLRGNLDEVINSAVDSGDLTIYSSKMMAQAYEIVFQLVPAILIIMAIISTLFIFYMGCLSIRKKGGEIPKYIPFSSFSFSRGIIFGSLFILILGVIFGKLGITNLNVIMLNLSAVIWTVFCIQGTSVLIYIKNLGRFSNIIFIILLCLLIISTIGTVVLFFTGLFDLLINIRGIIEAKRRR